LNGAIAVLDVFLRDSSNDAAHNRFTAAVARLRNASGIMVARMVPIVSRRP
jgi:hypothetical protein